MQVAVISDVHAHLDALERVLTAAEKAGADEIWFLGDAVGYGPFPNEVVDRLSSTVAKSVDGNHDRLVVGGLKFGEYREHSSEAIASGEWTKEQLTSGSVAWLKKLPEAAKANGFALHHARPGSITEYVYADWGAAALINTDLDAKRRKLHSFLLGHVHAPFAWSFDRTDALENGYICPVQHTTDDGTTLALNGKRWVFNPGAVAFSRTEDGRAHWLLLDLDAQTATFKRTAVDHDRTRQAIIDSGLPAKIAGNL